MLLSTVTRPFVAMLLLISTLGIASVASASGRLLKAPASSQPPLPSVIAGVPALATFLGRSDDTRLAPTADNPSSEITRVWDTLASAWKYQSRYDYFYDASGNPTVTEYYYSPTGTNSWDTTGKIEYTYDGDGFLVAEEQFGWVDSFYVLSHADYVNDANGNPVDILLMVWNHVNSTLENYAHWTYTYNASGLPLEYVTQNWSGSTWTNSSRNLWTYDGNDRITQVVVQIWTGLGWMDGQRIVPTYDVNGDAVTLVASVWNGVAWNDIIRVTQTYDSSHRLLTQTLEQFIGLAWVLQTRQTNTYDAEGNILSMLGEEWNGSAWENVGLLTATWSSGKNPPAISSDIMANLLEVLEQEWASGAWRNKEHIGYTYGTTTAVADDRELPSEYRLEANYPNPFNPSTEIAFSLPRASQVRVSVTDVLGRDVAEVANTQFPAGRHSVTWSPGVTPGGVYFYTIEAGEFRETRKMLYLR